MHTIQTKAAVTADHQLTLSLPPEIQAGEYQVVIVLEAQPRQPQTQQPLQFPVDDYGPWPTDLSLHREEMYGDFGR
ncbi:hypothetical protein XM38_004090 [Halomicronema hongdechloris C2206]|uniref:Uncharacterized protein n=1 Tax=Halomicronema hongdechloris C2206 TaxID=1641165 RepID=A0A1Z3HGN5_9CYAN|nr:hypothetical protein [Halomicronema hongdechloris]ASC69482.1 hypothetical protein XM38_004090 [Halomicronema hongdechloris C2206]